MNCPFHNAVKKYGYKNFCRTTIKIFNNTQKGKELAYKLEKIIVNSTLLKSKNCYNSVIGGQCGINLNDIKKVYMFDLKGNFLRSFKTSREAAIYINPENIETCRVGIKNNCLGITNSSYNYFWSYKKEFNYRNIKNRPIAQYTLSGKFLRTFDSITEAECELNVNSIYQAINKHYQCGGFQWRYFNGNTNNIGKLLNVFSKNTLLPILMYDKNNKLISEYKNVQECVKENPILKTSQINRVLKNIIKSHKGYIFKYKNEDIV